MDFLGDALDLLVGVDEGQAELDGQALADGRFSAAHKPDHDDRAPSEGAAQSLRSLAILYLHVVRPASYAAVYTGHARHIPESPCGSSGISSIAVGSKDDAGRISLKPAIVGFEPYLCHVEP